MQTKKRVWQTSALTPCWTIAFSTLRCVWIWASCLRVEKEGHGETWATANVGIVESPECGSWEHFSPTPWLRFFQIKLWSRAGVSAPSRGGTAAKVPEVRDAAVHSTRAWKPGWGGQIRLSSEKLLTAGHVFSTHLSDFWGHSANPQGFDGACLVWLVLLWYHPTPVIGVLCHWLFCHFLPAQVQTSQKYVVTKTRRVVGCFKSVSSTTSKCR